MRTLEGFRFWSASMGIVLMLVLSGAHAVSAEPEVHAISVHDGSTLTDGRIHGPEVKVDLDRPGETVILALGSRLAVRWRVSATEGTMVETTIVFGEDAARSEVFVNDIMVETTVAPALSYVSQKTGMHFRKTLAGVAHKAGVDVVASFQADNKRQSSHFVINAVSQNKMFKVDYLSDAVRPDAVPEALGSYLSATEATDDRVTMEKTGFKFRPGDGSTQNIEVTLDVPRIHTSVAAAYDEGGNNLYGLSAGGNSYLYKYDLTDQKWSAIFSNASVGAHSLLFDATGSRLIVGFTGRERGVGVLTAQGKIKRIPVSFDDLVGFGDLYRDTKGRSVQLIPIAIDGNKLLAYASNRARTRSGGNMPVFWRRYIIDVETGQSQLVAYQDAFE